MLDPRLKKGRAGRKKPLKGGVFDCLEERTPSQDGLSVGGERE